MSSAYQTFLTEYPYTSSQLAKRHRLTVPRINQMTAYLQQRGYAIRTDGGWRFTKEADRMIKNRRSEILPYL